MKGKMTPVTRAELADAIRARYAAASSKEKGRILRKFIAATGYHEKSAIRLDPSSKWQTSGSPCEGFHGTLG